jgi:hypothetical protein
MANFLERDFMGVWWLERGLSAAIGSVPRAPHPTPPIWLSAALPAREEGGIQRVKRIFCLLQLPFVATAPLASQWV